jgi:hypothetical protein
VSKRSKTTPRESSTRPTPAVPPAAAKVPRDSTQPVSGDDDLL